MADSACSVCGFSTNDLADFEKHVQQHEDTFTPKVGIWWFRLSDFICLAGPSELDEKSTEFDAELASRRR